MSDNESTLKIELRKDESLYYDYVEDVVCTHNFFENGRLMFGVMVSTECDLEQENLLKAMKMWNKAVKAYRKEKQIVNDVSLMFRFNLLEEIKAMVDTHSLSSEDEACPRPPPEIEESEMPQFNVLREELTEALALLNSIQVVPDIKRCSICERALDNGNPESLDCGGDCWGCVKQFEGPTS